MVTKHSNLFLRNDMGYSKLGEAKNEPGTIIKPIDRPAKCEDCIHKNVPKNCAKCIYRKIYK